MIHRTPDSNILLSCPRLAKAALPDMPEETMLAFLEFHVMTYMEQLACKGNTRLLKPLP